MPLKINKMIRGDWKLQSGSPRLRGVRLKDVPPTPENLDVLLSKLSTARDMPTDMKKGIQYKCARMIEDIEKNKEFFVDKNLELRNAWKKFREEKNSITNGVCLE